ncbi:MAG TPA: hypothetical protein VF120_17040 [Ktedonobacterales bacterium]
MIDELKRAVERAAQQPESEQIVLARLLNETIDADSRWDELLHDPRGLAVLEQMAQEAHEEHLRGETRDIDELFAEEDEREDELP